MSSNTPPPITPNTNTDANFTHDDNYPPTANVVTQASQLAHEFNLVSTSTQQMNRNNLREAFLDIQEEEYILEHANLKTTPIMAPSTVAYFPTPMNPSPDTSKKRIHSMMDSATMNNIDRATTTRKMVLLASSSSKKALQSKRYFIYVSPTGQYYESGFPIGIMRKTNNESIINTSISKALMVQCQNN